MIFRALNPSIDDIVLDVVLSETHTVTVEVTDNPTEGGRLDGGTKRTLPKMLTLTGAVTARDMRIGRAAPFVDGTRHFEAWQRLTALWESPETFDVITDVRTYRNCTGVGELTWDREGGSPLVDACVFTGTFREVQSGSAQVEPIPDEGAALDLTEGTDLGRQGLGEEVAA